MANIPIFFFNFATQSTSTFYEARRAPDPLAQLTEIRAIMERSSRFLSLSGLSGVGAGVVALLGSAAGHFYLQSPVPQRVRGRRLQPPDSQHRARAAGGAAVSAAAGRGMIGAALLVAVFFTRRRTHRSGQTLWSSPARRLAVALAVPLVAGGLFCLRLYLGGDAGMVVPGLLVFYGLALLNASKYTLDEIRWLGPHPDWAGAAGHAATRLGPGLLCTRLWPGPHRLRPADV